MVDDCSPEGDVAALVKSVAGDRVTFVRNERNLGMAGCWNKCVQIARGRWVHLLHQDDYLNPGFYERLEQAEKQHPDVDLLATRSFLSGRSQPHYCRHQPGAGIGNRRS